MGIIQAIRYIKTLFEKEPLEIKDIMNFEPKISNVIQYDSMGYPLRLIINAKGEQVWLDTVVSEGDVELKWYHHEEV